MKISDNIKATFSFPDEEVVRFLQMFPIGPRRKHHISSEDGETTIFLEFTLAELDPVCVAIIAIFGPYKGRMKLHDVGLYQYGYTSHKYLGDVPDSEDYGSQVRNNLMKRPGYTPYCGRDHCFRRLRFKDNQFSCLDGYTTEFPDEFIEMYRNRWIDFKE